MRQTKNHCALVVFCALGLGFLPSQSKGQDFASSAYYNFEQSDFGGVGLLQTPTARFNSNGELSIHYSDTEEYRRMAVSLQLFPWLETTARYTDIRYQLYSQSPGFSGDQTLKDKGFDAKLLLMKEHGWYPQIAVGLRDFGGTGIFAGEYFVANKAFGNFDISAGIGWGYLGRRDNITNPFCELSNTMCERNRGTSGRGGKFEVDKWFRGPAALFGGIRYKTPIDGLTVMAEYDSNDYQRDDAGRPMPVDSPINIGAHYQLNDSVAFKAGYQRGNTFSFGFTVQLNFERAYQTKREPQKRKAQVEQSPNAHLTDIDLERLARDIYLESGYAVNRIGASDNTVTLYGTQIRFRDDKEGIDRASRVLADTLPENITRYEFAQESYNFDLAQHNVNAPLFKDAYRGEAFYAEPEQAISKGYVSQRPTVYQAPNSSPFSYNIQPLLTQSFGGPESFYIYQLSLLGTSRYQINSALDVSGRLGLNLVNNYDKFNFLVDAYADNLPRVRTRIREYAANQDAWVEALQVNYNYQPSNDTFMTVYGGYLERMYAGVGTEWLYRPVNSNWAFGVDVNYAQQRAPGSVFGLEDYDVITGHASAYWKLPFLGNSTGIIRAGQFLAGDQGVHLEFQHEFKSGVLVGAYAAFTDVSSDEYGEGSFTKGFYLSIPFDLFFVRNSKARASIGWSPILRDGGQMLYRNRQLYYMTLPRN